ncbi:MAG: phosphoenolpyruvate carboxylase, partial [Cyanobacteria bacterium P01_D01_bin.44]
MSPLTSPDTQLDRQIASVTDVAAHDWFLRHRLKTVEDIWETVIGAECGQDLVELLNRLRRICLPDGQADTALDTHNVLEVIEQLSLEEAIRMARAFALYFQLINIVEQHYEQRGQQRQYRAAYEEAAVAAHGTRAGGRSADRVTDNGEGLRGSAGKGASFLAGVVEKSIAPHGASSKDVGTFYWLFPTLKQLNVPPQLIQRLIDQLDVRLVFTAHPTEIVRHTIRDKQRRISDILRQLDRAEESARSLGLPSSWEVEGLQSQLTEEIRLWWRTDELHQFKPSVLDEVDFTLHYFDVVLFDAIPQLYGRFKRALKSTFPSLQPPKYDFCRFGSWVGSDRDGNPSVTPIITWKTACYQRNLVIEKYLTSIRKLTNLLSPSLHWSEVLSEVLESLEQDRLQMPDVYEQLSIRYRQEPYRLKLAFIEKRLQNTRDRSLKLYNGDYPQDNEPEAGSDNTLYSSGDDFLAELNLLQQSLNETGLVCRELGELITQVDIYGFRLAQLDIRQESSRHSDTLNEITEYLQILPKPYNDLTEAEKTAWLVQELKTRRPLIPSEMPFSDKTKETIATFRMARKLHQEFGISICR